MGGTVGDIIGDVGDVFGSAVSKITDDILGYDPGGGGIYEVYRDVLGDDIADDLLGFDPGGGGAVPVINAAQNAATAYILGNAIGSAIGVPSSSVGSSSAATAAESAAAADAAFIAADAAQLAAQGLSEAQIASTLSASGASTGASNLAASMAVNGLDTATMTQQLGNLSTNTGLFTQNMSDAAFNAADAAQLAQQTGNNIAAIEQNLIAAGVDPLEAASLAQEAVLSSGAAPTQGMWDQFTNYLKENPSLLKTLGKAASLGATQIPQTQTANIPVYQPASTMPTYSPEYYQQVQQYYNTYLPSTPRDVATPLQEWYSSGYTQPDSVTAKLFSGV